MLYTKRATAFGLLQWAGLTVLDLVRGVNPLDYSFAFGMVVMIGLLIGGLIMDMVRIIRDRRRASAQTADPRPWQ